MEIETVAAIFRRNMVRLVAESSERNRRTRSVPATERRARSTPAVTHRSAERR